MIDRYKSFLHEIGFWPLDINNWNMFDLQHVPPDSQEDKLENEKFITKQVEKKSGIYIYQDFKEDILYVGKAKLLRNRLISHYRESFMQVPGDTKDNKWHRFFVEHRGNVKVYWRELNGEENRKIVEQMLDYILSPKFKEWK